MPVPVPGVAADAMEQAMQGKRADVRYVGAQDDVIYAVDRVTYLETEQIRKLFSGNCLYLQL